MCYSPHPMPSDAVERRSSRRVPARVPLTITDAATKLQATGQTRDLSSSGIFFYTTFPIRQGSSIDLVLMLPPELTSGDKSWVCCQATVVRVEDKVAGDLSGVAAKVVNMQVLPVLGEGG
jgi:hypothetical protein